MNWNNKMDRQNITYYKMMRSDYTHHNFTYVVGLNIDTQQFNPGSCTPGGLYFTDIDNLHKFFEYGTLVAFITIPDNAQIYKDPYENKWKADLFIIKKIEPLWSFCHWNARAFCLRSVKQKGIMLQYVKDQSLEICLEAVKQNYDALQYVKDQSLEICLEAIKQNSYALQYVKDQTPELCIESVKQNGCALRFVEDQTSEICLEAVKQNGCALQYVKDQTFKICLEAVKQNSCALQYVDDSLYAEVQRVCVVRLNDSFRYIKKPIFYVMLTGVLLVFYKWRAHTSRNTII